MISINKSLLMTALITGTVLWGGTAVHAETIDEFDLDTMVVTATRTEKNILKVPASVSVITRQDMENRNVTTIRDAIKNEPGFMLEPTDQPYDGIKLRGFDSSNVLVLYDGQPMNNSWNGQVNWDSIPVEKVERIEVVRGAGSALYGGRAVGGVINIISKEAQKDLSGSVVLSYGSNNTWKKGVSVDTKVNDKWSFGIGYEQRKTNGINGYRRAIKQSTTKSSIPKDADIDMELNLPTAADGESYIVGGRGKRIWKSDNYSANVGYNFDENKSLKYTFTRSEYEYRYGKPYTYIKDANGNDVWQSNIKTQNGHKFNMNAAHFLGNNGERETNTHILNYIDKKNLFTVNMGLQDVQKDGYTSVSTTKYKKLKDINYSGAGDYSYYPSKNYNADIQKTWENIGKHTITVGANWKDEQMERISYALTKWQDSNSKTKVSEWSRGKARTTAIFVQDEYKFSDPFTMYLGGRYDTYKKYNGSNNYSGGIPSETFHEFSPKVAFEWAPNDTTSYYVSYGHSFNTPKLYNMYRDTSSVDANPGLKPETSDTFEIGFKKKIENTTVSISSYKVKTEDEIYYAKKEDNPKKSGKRIYINGDEGRRKGIELDLTHKFDDRVSAYLNYAWQESEVTSAESTMTSADTTAPKHLLHMGVEYNVGKLNTVLDAQYVSARQAADTVTGEYGSYDPSFVMNTYFNYRLNKDATLQFGIENLLDREYYSDQITKGRTFNVGLRYNF